MSVMRSPLLFDVHSFAFPSPSLPAKRLITGGGRHNLLIFRFVAVYPPKLRNVYLQKNIKLGQVCGC